MTDTDLAENTTSHTYSTAGFTYTLSICCLRGVIYLLYVPCFSCVSCEPYRHRFKKQLYLEQNRAEFMTSHSLLYDMLFVGNSSLGFVVFLYYTAHSLISHLHA